MFPSQEQNLKKDEIRNSKTLLSILFISRFEI